jgi:hypothetical protein
MKIMKIPSTKMQIPNPPPADWILFGIWVLEFGILGLYLGRQIAFI